MVLCTYLGVTGYGFQNYIVFLSLKMDFVLANSADPDEMLHYAAFHLVFTVSQHTHLGVSGLQRVNG